MKVLSLEQQKLATLCNIEGFESLDRPLEAAALDSVSPAICMTEGCSYTCEMEPDQDRGWREECRSSAAAVPQQHHEERPHPCRRYIGRA